MPPMRPKEPTSPCNPHNFADSLLKQEAMVVKPPEWTFMAIIATNAKLLSDLGQKWQKSLIIFNNFTLVSLKITKLITI